MDLITRLGLVVLFLLIFRWSVSPAAPPPPPRPGQMSAAWLFARRVDRLVVGVGARVQRSCVSTLCIAWHQSAQFSLFRVCFAFLLGVFSVRACVRSRACARVRACRGFAAVLSYGGRKWFSNSNVCRVGAVG